ncbi:MAG: hypothetical protein ACK4V0_00560 [Aphanizomenon sp.]|jgi:hypothetical protein
MNNPQQPREYDAVLGGNSPSLEGAAVLGGIEGVKLRLQNPDAKVKIVAIREAFNYEEQGLDLLIESLNDKSLEILTGREWEAQQKIWLQEEARKKEEEQRQWEELWNTEDD